MAVGDITQGRRVDDLSDCLKPGDYWLGPTNVVGETFNEMWMRLPCPREFGGVALRKITDMPGGHTFTEHEDGTVTVGGSILALLAPDHRHGWHGYLERGVWREV